MSAATSEPAGTKEYDAAEAAADAAAPPLAATGGGFAGSDALGSDADVARRCRFASDCAAPNDGRLPHIGKLSGYVCRRRELKAVPKK